MKHITFFSKKALIFNSLAFIIFITIFKTYYETQKSINPIITNPITIDPIVTNPIIVDAKKSPTLRIDKLSSPDSFQTWLIEEELNLWKELENTIKLSKDKCQQLKNEWYNDFQQGEQALHKSIENKAKISPHIVQRIELILKDFGITTQQLPIRQWTDKSAAAATDSALFINEQSFSQLPLKAQKFVIGHEIQHFINKDCSTNYVIERYSNEQHERLSKDHPISKLLRFQELRADIKSGLAGHDYAQGYTLYAEHLTKKGNNIGKTHPKNSLRLTISKNIATSHRLA